jgi:heptosyltransferase-2
VRVWPLGHYRRLVNRLRTLGYAVQLACDPDQAGWWRAAGEPDVVSVERVPQLFRLIDQAAAFVGNDSGPGHLAAVCGVPTFTIFGPQLPQWFAPLHPHAAWVVGRPCPYRPCSDYCHFRDPVCIVDLDEEQVLQAILEHLRQHGPPCPAQGVTGS